ncbi:hypothetical protein AN3544.2 [Aspergillus nidulans FGSC A4]|nr:hypothetical protein AN3544.2 [Aspergillus nidulans FGSC A4]|eukprot:XP_661148.1 hypothetical protein AN3544.2 [Aspergillus nidulans FGSC A4]
MVADDQLVLLNDWKLAMTSLAKALDLTVSSLQGRPRDLARGLAARFVSLAKQDSPQLIPLMTAAAPPQPSRQIEQPNQPPTPEACEGPLKRRTSQPTTWASLTAPRAGQGNWQTIAPEHRTQAKQPAQRKLKQPNKTDHRIFLCLPASSSLRAIRPHGIRVTLAGKVPDRIAQVQARSSYYQRRLLALAGDGYFEIPTEYHQVIVPRIPKQLWSLDGWIDTTITDISNKAECITRRGGTAHDLLLSFEADIILVQEPWTNTAKHLTKTHPQYQLFSPPTRWTARPRTLTYVQRDLPAHSLPEPISPDITTIYTAGLTIINIYRPPNDPVAPAGAGSTPSTLSTLLGYAPPENTILAGDFNTRHPFWQPDTESHAITPGATGLLDWLDAHELELRLEPGTPTRGPNTLDLVFSNLPLRALVEDHLKTPSDHATIGIILEQEEPPPIYKLGSTNWEKARALASPPDPTLPIDLLAKQLVQTSQLAIQGASRYNTCRLPRTPWWTPELTDILHQTRQQQNPNYKQLQKAIVQAKAEYWKQRIEQATAPIDAFKLAK